MITSRPMQVLTILLRDKKTTIKKIAEELEVNTRTIERNIDLLTLRGVPVTTIRGRNGGVVIDEKYKIDKELFSTRDIQELFVALNIYSNIVETEFVQQMHEKMIRLNPENAPMIQQIINNYVKVDLFDKPLKLRPDIENRIAAALANEKQVEIVLKGGEKIALLPLSYVIKADGIYLYGRNEDYQLIAIIDIVKVTEAGRPEGYCAAECHDYFQEKKKLLIHKSRI